MKILNYLQAGKKETRENLKVLTANALKREQKKLLQDLEAEKDENEFSLERLRCVNVEDIDVSQYIQDFNTLSLEAEVITVKLRSAKKVYKELFGKDKTVVTNEEN